MSVIPECIPTIEELFEDGVIDEQELSQMQDDRKQQIRKEIGRDYTPDFEKDMIRNIQLGRIL